jgi:hypothetical protein
MNIDNPFDRKLEATKRMPESMRGALVDCVDTLDLCWAGAQAVFGPKAKPEHALALLPVVIARQASIRATYGHPGPPTEPPARTADAP